MTAAGDLRHRVTLQRNAITQDPKTGAMVSTWNDVADVWAQVAPLSGREYLAAQATQSEVQARIVIRYRDDVDAAMRVMHGTRIYEIKAVLPDADSGREHLTLMCGEGVRLDQ